MPLPPCRPLACTLAAVLLTLAVLAPGGAVAQAQVPFAGLGGDRSAPVELSAERLEVDQATGRATFTGEVTVVQGDLRLSAARVLVEYATDDETGRNRIARLLAEGEVLLVTPEEAAEAAEAVYDLDAGEIALAGDVLLTQGGNALAGDRLVIDLASRTGRMEGRVRTVILPDASR